MKIWHILNSLCVVDGGSFIIKSIVFFNDQWRLPEPVLSDDGNLLWHVFVMIYDSLQPAILNCGIFLLKIYLLSIINNDNMPLKFTPCLLHKHLGKFWSFQGCNGKRRWPTSYDIVSQLRSFHIADLSSCQWTLTAVFKYADSGEPHISWSPACVFCSGNLFGCERYSLYYFKHDFV